MRIRIYMFPIKRLIFGKGLRKLRFRLRQDESGKYYQRHVNDDDKYTFKKIKKYCKWRFIRCHISDDSMERSNTYRTEFFKNNRGILGRGNYYLCAYCGRLLRRNSVRVDHIISIYLAQHSEKHRRMLTAQGIKNVNDPKNLTPSCTKCNSIKSSKGGLWIPRGYFGRSWVRVLLSRIVLVLLILAIFYLLLSDINDHGIVYTFFLSAWDVFKGAWNAVKGFLLSLPFVPK